MKNKPVIRCNTSDVFEARLAAMFNLLDKALELNAKGIEWSNKQINERLDKLETRNSFDESKTVPTLLGSVDDIIMG